jgi:serine O-acetyltransferase
MFDNLRRDQVAYDGEWYRRAGFWITVVHRFGVWADLLPSPFLRVPMWTLYFGFKLVLGMFTSNIILWAGRCGTCIGPGLSLVHPFNILIGRDVKIGENCQIYHEVTMGTGQIPGMPKIGNHVTIYPGARLLGGIVIGDGTMIGANCVVTKDVPAGSVIVAAPSRIIPRSLSTQARRWDEPIEPVQSLSKETITPQA